MLEMKIIVCTDREMKLLSDFVERLRRVRLEDMAELRREVAAQGPGPVRWQFADRPREPSDASKEAFANQAVPINGGID